MIGARNAAGPERQILSPITQGDFTQYQVDWEDRQLVVRSTVAEPLAEGERAYLTVDPRRCVLLEPEPPPA